MFSGLRMRNSMMYATSPFMSRDESMISKIEIMANEVTTIKE